ncbi:6,7,8-trihydroxycoumarin synthase-like [Salvia miltiorrhiza]|uniref:6,7,8-trihydroxycoumarin synthase-like n=1 Tax=Salvia miltiorrhiza TaxID=226208 RepID=UPI0025ACF3FF|nr:6,7,8-trihydroxycoumarin synthase-like [Salvia miltiorrhiza]
MQFILILFLALPIILILYSKTQNPKHAQKELPPPGPPRLPFIGNLHQFDGRSPHTYLRRLSKQYGAVMSLQLGFRQLVVISSAEAVKEIMKSHDTVFSSRPALAALRRLSYDGLDFAFSPYTETSREMKKISTVHLFNTKQVQTFLPIIRDEASKMMEKIATDASSSAATDLSETIMSFAANTVARVVLGKSYGNFFHLLHDAEAVLGDLFMEDFLPWLRWIDNLSGMAAKLDKIFQDMDAFCEEVIEEHMNPNRPKSMEGDIIDVMLRMKRDGSASFDITLDHIKALLVVTFPLIFKYGRKENT